MGIEILSPQVVDQIAAGEVVERPAHMVKELVENSLDSGASEIEVEFSDGGRQVRVTDNGQGILANELPLAVARHATSKIRNSSDLWTLASFGFRGEALATIAAVSDFEITSRHVDDSGAHALRVEFGSVQDVVSKSGSQGTSVWVKDLFANVPARLKFLKSAQAEGQQIRSILKAMALSYPRVQFRIKSQKELLAYWPAKTSFVERAQQVLEVSPLYGTTIESDDWRVEVALSDPYRTEKTSRQIWIFVQGRFVQDRGLQAAVLEAYRHLLMHGEFPVAVVKVQAPPSEVDINIHPTKSAVKFQNPSLAFRKVLEACRKTLEATPWRVVGEPVETKKPWPSAESDSSGLKVGANESPEQKSPHLLYPDMALLRQLAPTLKSSELGVGQNPGREARGYSTQSWQEPLFLRDRGAESQPKPAPAGPSAECRSERASWRWVDLKIMGQVRSTYVVVETREGMILIDQHAAHERVAFERLRQAWNGGNIEVQQYLLPLTMDLDVELTEVLLASAPQLEKLGIQLEQSGPGQVAVMAAPAMLKEEALAEALHRWAREHFEHGGSEAVEAKVGEILATLACHSVVRAGQTLDLAQMRSLLEQMDEFPQSEFCPHGRPVHIVLPWTQIERDFGRLL